MPRLPMDSNAVEIGEAGFVLAELLCGSRELDYPRIAEATNRIQLEAGRILPEDFDYDLLSLGFSSDVST